MAPIPMQVAKLSVETWTLPVHAPEVVWAVSVAKFIAVLNVSAIVEATGTFVVASAGVMLMTCGVRRHAPVLSQPFTQVVVQQKPVPAAPQMPDAHWLFAVQAA